MTTELTPLPSRVDPAAFLDIFVQSDLSANELRVAAALAQCAVLVDGEPNLQLARWEIAEHTGLSQAMVQRALSSLAASGYIGRSQDAKARGEIAITTVTERLLGLFGLAGGIRAPSNVPSDLLGLLVRETVEVANAITQAWEDATLPPARVASAFRGGAGRWAQIEFLLLGRIEASAMEAAQAATTLEGGGADPGTSVLLPDGSEIQFCTRTFKDCVSGANSAMAGADLRFATEVLSILGRRAPRLLRVQSASALAAEALYSRQRGFVHRHDFIDAARIVASIMAKGSWSAPRGIDARWYAAVGASMSVANRVFNSAPLN